MGIGMSTTQKSYRILKVPWITRWILSLMQCWGTNERVQYAEIGLLPINTSSLPQTCSKRKEYLLALENHNNDKDQTISRHKHYRKSDEFLKLFVTCG